MSKGVAQEMINEEAAAAVAGQTQEEGRSTDIVMRVFITL